MYLPDIASMLSLASIPSDPEFTVGGYYTPGDGGGGTFIWIPNPPSPATPPPQDDGIIFHYSGTVGGYFKRLYSGPVNVRWFGAIMGATDPNPTPHTITDVTSYFEAARDSSFTKSGTLYFPEDRRFDSSGNPYIEPYVGAFNLLSRNINVLGDGVGSILKANGSGPVLKLGNNSGAFWLFCTITRIKIEGTASGIRYDGVWFEDQDLTLDLIDATQSPPQPGEDGVLDTPFPGLAGRWVFENVTFEGCDKGVHKPFGNIGNSFINCTWAYNNYGYYAKSSISPGMHSGCDKIIGGHIGGSVNVGICIMSEGLYGQFVVDGTVIENNPGMGIFVKFTGSAIMTFCSIDIRNVWMEANCVEQVPNPGTPPPAYIWQTVPNVTIDNVSYNNYYYRFEGVRSVSISNSRVRSMNLIGSSVNLYNCRSDNAYGFPVDDAAGVDVDASSSIVAYEIRNIFTISENIFVQSLSYDGTGDLTFTPNALTSVWGPLRTTLMAGLHNAVFWSGPQEQFVSEIWPGYSGGSDGYATDTPNAGTALNYVDVSGAVPPQMIVCKEMDLNDGQIVSSPATSGFPVRTGYYYFWSIHAYLCQGKVTGWFGVTDSNGDGQGLGQVIFKEAQWACSYGIKKQAENASYNLFFKGLEDNSKFRFCHWQVLKFTRLEDAISYMNSKGIAYPGEVCYDEGTVE